MDYQIRLATINDLPAIVDIFNQAIPLQVNDESAPIEVADRREWFMQFDSTHPIWVATMDDQVIAWCALEYFYPHPAYDHSAQIAIYIHEDYRRQHLGHDLLTYAQKQIEDHLDIRTVIAYIYIENHASYHLFTSCGYKEWGKLPQISEINGQMRSLYMMGRHFNE